MKIKWGALVVDGRGKLGGHVASKNRGGNFLRTKVTPTNPSTLAQTLVRTIFAVITTGWSTLTNAQRASFNGAVEDFSTTDIFGDIKKPSGKNLHQKLNQNLLLINESLLVTAPTKLAFPDASVSSVEIDINNEETSFNGLEDAGSIISVISATGPLTDGTTNAKNRFRTIFFSASNEVGQGASVYTAYVNKFGTPINGQNIQFGVQFVLASGQKSPMQILTATYL